MKRVDIVLNQAIEEDFFALCKERGVPRYYTKYSDVHGEGIQVPKHGSPIWPQLNTSLVLVCDEDNLSDLKEIICELRKNFPNEGVFCTVTDVEVI